MLAAYRQSVVVAVLLLFSSLPHMACAELSQSLIDDISKIAQKGRCSEALDILVGSDATPYQTAFLKGSIAANCQKDQEEAAKWFGEAARYGDKTAVDWLRKAGKEIPPADKAPAPDPCQYGRAPDTFCLGAPGSIYCGEGRSCPAGNQCVNRGKTCMPSGSVDCGDYICPPGNQCAQGAKTCVPPGYSSCGGGVTCPPKTLCTYDNKACIPPNVVYCGGGRSCPAGSQCANGGAQCLVP